MKISPVTYTNYQPGFTFNPLSGTSKNQTTSQAGNIQDASFVVNPPAQQPSGPEKSSSGSQADQNPQQNYAANPDTGTTNPDPEKTDQDKTTQGKTDQGETREVNGRELDQNELRQVEALKKIDTEVRQHEMAHVAAGGRYITSGANFSYEKGPDGKNYAVGGEVSIDTAPIPGDPEATIRKMRQVKNAALAPASPSSQDLKVASKATSAASKALSELMMLQAKQQASANENQAFGDMKNATDSYETVGSLPEGETSSFKLAV